MLVKTDLRAEPQHKGMSLLLVEKGPGFKVVRKLEKLGYRGIDTGGDRVRGLPRAGRQPDRRRRKAGACSRS